MRWTDVGQTVPELAATAEAMLTAHRHLTMATVRADGSPRISGTEVTLVNGDFYLAGMCGSRRFADLRRDPRVAVHCASADPAQWIGDAKFGARAVEVDDPEQMTAFRTSLDQVPEGPFELFVLDIEELTVTRLGEDRDHLVIETWHHTRGLLRVERR